MNVDEEAVEVEDVGEVLEVLEDFLEATKILDLVLGLEVKRKKRIQILSHLIQDNSIQILGQILNRLIQNKDIQIQGQIRKWLSINYVIFFKP